MLPHRPLSDEAFRQAFRDVLARSGRSMRSLSLAMGRDPGYVAALLDPTRPSRARPTPEDLIVLSDATGLPFIELLEALWAVPVERLRTELGQVDPGGLPGTATDALTPADRRTIADLAAFLATRRRSNDDPGRTKR